MSRREFLKKVGLAGLAGLAAASSVHYWPDLEPSDEPEAPDVPTRTPPEESADLEERYDTVVDAVEAGADPEGNEPVDPVISEHAGDDTLLSFPAGTYVMDPFSLSGLTNAGFRGADGGETTFVPTSGNCRGGVPYVHFDGVADLLLQDLVFDFRQADAGGPIHLFLEGDSTVRNVEVDGSCSNQIGVVRVDVRDEGGTAVFEEFQARNGEDNKSLTGIFVGTAHTGEVTFRDCQVEGFSDNGLYASAPGEPDGGNGSVHAVGGTFSNNNIANVRLGSTGSTAQGVTVQVDTEPPGWNELNARGIRLRRKQDQVIEECDITFGAGAAQSFGAIVFHPENGGALVRDTTVRIDRDTIPAIRAFPIAEPGDASPVFENVSVTGEATGGFVARIEERDGTVFRGCTVEQTGEDRSGLILSDSQGCRIVDSHIEVATEPIVLHNATVRLENTTIVTPAGERTFRDEVVSDQVVAPD